ncbi:unnamed protein product [Diabrotica balteata]|uniref:EF-hand domain-containing protein n=1 Tax=Diabrotica balteata TaxID=107213 RepID=A0A9N9SYZ5_DIABA|nr:unnamed protein product [Diabrotica balteata]
MNVAQKIKYLECLRWSYTVPILCYLAFFVMIWMLAVPLKHNIKIVKDLKVNVEDSFEIRIKNSNFNTDKRGEEELIDKNEYLVDFNKDGTRTLMEVFEKADKDKNNKLDSKELAMWIRQKIVEHISTAISSNLELFNLIDVSPQNGVITWREYHTYFLKKRGFSDKFIGDHDEKRHRGLERSLKGTYLSERIMRDKAAWTEAAKSNPNTLTIDEFLSFTHPESSVTNQLMLVDELFDKFDRDGDELLTEDEFAVLQTEGNGDEPLIVRQDENERREEFRKRIDLNGDGRADRRELLHYVAPQSPRHSEHEAEALLALADNDHDQMLSLDEMLAHPDLFLKSKMVDTARSFHDEF